MNVNYSGNFRHSAKYSEVEVNLATLMDVWKSSWQALYYSEKGYDNAGDEVVKSSRRDFYQRKIRDGEPILPPRLFISSRGEPEVIDGLVRLVVLKQMGAEKVRLCVPKADAQEFMERFGAEKVRSREVLPESPSATVVRQYTHQ